MKCNARPAPKSHVSDFRDISTKSLWLYSGWRQPIQKRTRLTEKTPAMSACVKVWVRHCWHRCWVMPFRLCWRGVCIMVENSQVEYFCWDKLTKVASDCSKKCSVGHCVNHLFGFHEQIQPDQSEAEDYSTHGDFWCIFCTWVQEAPHPFCS